MDIKYGKRNISLIIGAVLALLVVIPVVAGCFWLPYDVNAIDGSAILKAPSLKHLFGTDNFGRDIFSRVLQGTGVTFMISLTTVLIGAVIGSVIGAFTGYYGGVVDEILMRINDGLASFPSILLALVVVSILDKGTANIVIALGIVFIPSFARIMRSEFMAQKSRDYVLNAKLMGAGDLRIMFVHIFPNTLPILLSTMLVGLNNAVLAEAGLSYLGLGVQPPDPSLGRMLAEAQVYIFSAPWYVVSTCAVMIALILGITLVSDNLGVSGVSLSAVKRKVDKMRAAQNRAEGSINTESSAGEADGNVAEGGTGNGGEGGTGNDGEGGTGNDGEGGTGSDKHAVPALDIKDLNISFIEDSGLVETIKDVDIELREGEILGLVGESGSGKSLTSLAVMGLLPERACITGGSIRWHGRELTGLDEDEYCRVRGHGIAMVFQEPMTTLNPVQRVGVQIDEVLDLHEPELPENEHRARVLKALDDVGLDDAEKVYRMYPHELSGGMRQRIVIAMALVAKADIIIADEPTTALDADVADIILEIFAKINRKYGCSIILISHDLRVIGRICSRAVVMKDGRTVETLNISRTGDEVDRSVFAEPSTEYGKRLLEAAFATKVYADGQTAEGDNIVSLRDFCVYYREAGRKFGRRKLVEINHNVNMNIPRGACVGIVGQSGCGKSTLVKAIAGLLKYTSGEIELNCSSVGMVFQDPYGSLNPSKTVGWLLEEPLKCRTQKSSEERRERVSRLLEDVGLEPEMAGRRINELSGGQRQRVAIALAVITHPELIILDEPVSALDVTIQEQILELLERLKVKYSLTYILISHDARLVSRVCDVVYPMKRNPQAGSDSHEA